MSDPKMQVIFVKQTGHVVAAFSRTADESKVKLEDVVGAGFPFRNMLVANGGVSGDEFVVLPPEALDVATVDFNEDTFLMPLNFVTSGSKVDQLGSVLGTAPVLTATQITVKATPPAEPVPEKTKVWAVVQQVPATGQEPLRRVVEGEIAIGASDVTLDLKSLPDKPPASIVPGNYDVLVLVAGRRRHFARTAVP